jgi:hypothetical protein
MKFVEIEGNKIKLVGGKRAVTVERIAVYMVASNDWPIAEWRDENGVLQTAAVCSLNLPFAPVPKPKPEPERAPPPPKKPPKKG